MDAHIDGKVELDGENTHGTSIELQDDLGFDDNNYTFKEDSGQLFAPLPNLGIYDG